MILALSAGRDAPAELRARIALDEAGQRKLLRSKREGIGELSVLCTCHRTEIYATADWPTGDALHAVAALLPDLRATDHNDMRFMDGSEAVEHLFRVACGLDSLMIGEPQVLGQVRRSYVLAQDEGTAGPVLSTVFGRAIKLGRSVRSQTTLGKIAKSVGSIAAAYLEAKFGGVGGRRGTIVGAGEAAADVARSLAAKSAELTILSRTPVSAKRLADELHAASGTLQDLGRFVDEADFVVVAVAGGKLLNTSQLPIRQEPLSPLVVLDLSVPTALEIDAPGIDVHALEDLPGPRGPEITAAVIDAEAMVKKEVAELERWLDTRASGPAIRSLRNQVERLVREETSRLIGGMDLTDDQRERIELLGMRIANKILHEPTKALREADEDTRSLIQKLFGLEI